MTDALAEPLLDRRLPDRASTAPLPMLRESASRILRQVDQSPGLYLAHAAGIGLVALIAYQCAALYGVIVTPLEGRQEAVRQPPSQPATLPTGFDPFFSAAPAHAIQASAASDLTLYGLRQDGRSGGGSAIISHSDGAQRSFGIGDEVASGIVLKRVGSDHAVVSRHGVDERLTFEDFESKGPSATPSTASATPPPYMTAPVASTAPSRIALKPAARGGTGLPARSVDFADPSTIPASLMAPRR